MVLSLEDVEQAVQEGTRATPEGKSTIPPPCKLHCFAENVELQMQWELENGVDVFSDCMAIEYELVFAYVPILPVLEKVDDGYCCLSVPEPDELVIDGVSYLHV